MRRAFLDRWQKDLRLIAFAAGDRNAVTARVRAGFGEVGAWITDVHFFSGLQTTLSIDVAPKRLRALQAALERAGVVFDDASRAVIDEAAHAPVDSLEGTLAIIFPHGDPNLRHPVPAVPG
jgi:hypothetical protein